MIYTLTALYPFVLLFILFVWLQRPALFVLPIVLLSTALGAYLVWNVESIWFGIAAIKSALVTLDIIYIIIGVLLLFQIQKKAGVFETFQHLIERLSDDRRVQAIIISWLFVSLLEGAAGFGTPGMIVAGLLVHIGFRPLLAVILPLIGGFVATTFGAVGVPITIGIAQGIPQYATESLLRDITNQIALFHLILGTCIPLVISCMTTFVSGGTLRKGFAIWKFALVSGLAFTLPMYGIAQVFGPEFPSIGAALLSLMIIFFMVKKKYLIPKNPYRFPNDEKIEHRKTVRFTLPLLFKTLFPYIILVLLLAVSRINTLPVWEILNEYSLSIPSILNSSISHTLYPLYSPGFFLIITACLSLLFFKLSKQELATVVSETSKRILIPFVILFCTLFTVNILLYSENNTTLLPSMLLYLVEKFGIFAFTVPLVAPFVGMIGAFVTGSVTLSNLLFASLQYESALQHGFSPQLILTLQTIGSSAGNMIAIHNIVAALSVVKLYHKESVVMRHTIIPTLLYVCASMLLGILFLSVK